MKRIIFILLILANSASAQVRTIPNFRFVRMDNGADFSNSNITAGKKTFFIFFDTECPHCRRAITEYNKSHLTMNNLNIVMVTRNLKNEVLNFLKTVGPILSTKKNTVLLYDQYNQFIGRFLPRKFPSMFLFDAKRQLMLYSDEESDIPTFIELFKK